METRRNKGYLDILLEEKDLAGNLNFTLPENLFLVKEGQMKHIKP
ncbi:hypothetical protein [Clostridium sp. Cult3]|nr:hypothetical protein [Clostridium sp. Cult3]